MKDAQGVVTNFIQFVLVLFFYALWRSMTGICDTFLYSICKALLPIIKFYLKLKANSLTCMQNIPIELEPLQVFLKQKQNNVLRMYFFGSPFVSKNIFYIKRKNQNTQINQVKMWYLFSSINTHVYSPVTCYIMLYVTQDTIIPYGWKPMKCTIFNFHQLCIVLTFIMLLSTNKSNWFYLMFITNSLLSIFTIEKI